MIVGLIRGFFPFDFSTQPAFHVLLLEHDLNHSPAPKVVSHII